MGWLDRIPLAVLPEGREGGGEVVSEDWFWPDPGALVLVVVSGSSTSAIESV